MRILQHTAAALLLMMIFPLSAAAEDNGAAATNTGTPIADMLNLSYNLQNAVINHYGQNNICSEFRINKSKECSMSKLGPEAENQGHPMRIKTYLEVKNTFFLGDRQFPTSVYMGHVTEGKGADVGLGARVITGF